MAKLSTHERKHLLSRVFGLPRERKYPMPDREHAADAKGRASEQVKLGNLSVAKEHKIDRKANHILRKRS